MSATKGRPRTWPIYDMEVGDIFQAGARTSATRQIASSANNKLAPKRFKSKTIDGIVTVARIA